MENECAVTLFSEDIRMGTGVEKQEAYLGIILLPYHNPIRFDMTFPLAFVISAQQVRMIDGRKGTGRC